MTRTLTACLPDLILFDLLKLRAKDGQEACVGSTDMDLSAIPLD